MCVKQFFGYSCGHCSIPTLIQCPLAASNQLFPTCSFPAERPIFTGMYCHPCFRVVWNFRVLKEEEEHRERHLKGECFCEVRFEGEDRDRHLRARAVNMAVEGTAQGQGYVHHGPSEATAANINRMGDPGQAFAQYHWQQQIPFSENDDVGYFPQEGIRMTDPNQSYAIAVDQQNSPGQLMMGETGSGMRWYPYPPALPPPSRPHHKTQKAPKAAGAKAARNSNLPPSEPRISAEDAETPVPESPAPEPVGGDVETLQPVVVSSSITEPKSA